MATVSLSSGVRSALTSLASTKADAAQSQYRLATGKKVNSAVDSPVNFFTAAGLNARAGQLTDLLDGISNSIQTITAASQGIDSITKLVNSLQSTIKQAQADNAANRPTTSGANASTALATKAEVDATGKSYKDVVLDKALVDDNGTTTDNDATATAKGNLGIVNTTTNLNLTISAGKTTFTSTSLTATSTVRDLVNEINKSGIATASVDDSGKINITGSGSDTLKVGLGAGATANAAATDAAAGGQNGKLGLAAAVATGLSSSGNSTVRSNLVSQFNDLRTQIDQLAKDAGFNGKNLLTGDKISVVFNEKTGANQSKLDVQGQTLTAANLGIDSAANGSAVTGEFNIQDDASLSTMADTLTSALSSLRSTSSSLGASLSTVQARQDFTKNLVNTLSQGADNLVLADTNEEGAKLLALQTRQQLSQTALSLSNQADQAVLRLF